MLCMAVSSNEEWKIRVDWHGDSNDDDDGDDDEECTNTNRFKSGKMRMAQNQQQKNIDNACLNVCQKSIAFFVHN